MLRAIWRLFRRPADIVLDRAWLELLGVLTDRDYVFGKSDETPMHDAWNSITIRHFQTSPM